MSETAVARINATSEVIETQSRYLPDRFMPVLNIQQAIQRRNALVEFVKALMERDRDYGTIPGTPKPTLYKPGAERLCSFFGLSPEFIELASIMDWAGEQHGGEPLFYMKYKCRLSRDLYIVGEGNGSCNSRESKYRYRSGERKCPKCEKSAIINGKAEYGGGFLCFAKKGGCGAKFKDGDPAITGQNVGKVNNPDIFDLLNTIDKMAQKRAFIAATLIAVNASEFFTQDIEDMEPLDDPGPPVGSDAAARAVGEKKITAMKSGKTYQEASADVADRIDNFDPELQSEIREREVIIGSIKGLIQQLAGTDVKRKKELIAQVFGQPWKAVELMPLQQLAAGAMKLEQIIEQGITERDMPKPEANIEVIWSDHFKMLADFQTIKAELKKELGPGGEAEYYRILSDFGVKKSNEFKIGPDAIRCFHRLRSFLMSLSAVGTGV